VSRGSLEVPAELIANVYEAVADASRWSDVVRRVARWVGGTAACLQVRRLWPDLVISQVWSGAPTELERAYAEHYARLDPWLERLAALPLAAAVLSRSAISDEELARTAFHAELLQPHGLRDALIAVLSRDEERAVVFSVFSEARLDDDARARLDAAVPHLARAARVALELEEHGDLGSAVQAATVARRLGVARVDAALHVLGGASGTEAWLAEGVGPLRAERRRLTTVDAADLEALRGAVVAAIAGRSSNVVLGRRSGDLVSVLVAPAPGASPLRPERSAHVLFAAPAEESRVSALRAAFGLTAAEARVAVKVARGQPLRRIATDLGVSYHTVRAHLRQCFAKTGARRQSALAALVHESA
jgi:DNA-binding CsgD family transcriptional regulator